MYSFQNLGMTVIFECCVGFLLLATIFQQWLYRYVRNMETSSHRTEKLLSAFNLWCQWFKPPYFDTMFQQLQVTYWELVFIGITSVRQMFLVGSHLQNSIGLRHVGYFTWTKAYHTMCSYKMEVSTDMLCSLLSLLFH